MRHIAQKMIALLLAMILAVVACFGDALHEVAHVHVRGAPLACSNLVERACCPSEPQHSGRSAACHAKDGSHALTSTQQTTQSGESTSSHHDRNRCFICRFLALPQLAETPQDLLPSEAAVYGRVAVTHTSPFLRHVSLVTIRGPPA
jgi:hypothetical protein